MELFDFVADDIDLGEHNGELIEEQIVSELAKRGYTTDDVETYHWETVVHVKVK